MLLKLTALKIATFAKRILGYFHCKLATLVVQLLYPAIQIWQLWSAIPQLSWKQTRYGCLWPGQESTLCSELGGFSLLVLVMAPTCLPSVCRVLLIHDQVHKYSQAVTQQHSAKFCPFQSERVLPNKGCFQWYFWCTKQNLCLSENHGRKKRLMTSESDKTKGKIKHCLDMTGFERITQIIWSRPHQRLSHTDWLLVYGSQLSYAWPLKNR